MVFCIFCQKKSSQPYFWLFWTLVSLHIAVWSFLPPFFSSFLADPLEMMVIGANGVLSTHKHPAFQGWLAEMFRQVFQSPDWVPYACSQLAVALSIYGIWQLAQKYLSPPLALLAALSMLSYRFFSYESVEYNNETFLRMFWIYAVLFLWMAIQFNQYRYWILTGLCLALGLYCKLTMFLLVITILAYMTMDSQARRYWKTPGPYLATFFCFLLFIPLLCHLFQNDFSPFHYADQQMSHHNATWGCHLANTFRFLISQFSLFLPLALPLLPLLGFHWKFRKEALWSSVEDRFLTFFLFFPIVFQLVILFFQGGDCPTRFGCHLWLFFTLFLLHVCRTHLTTTQFQRSLRIVLMLIVFYFLCWVTVLAVTPIFKKEKMMPEHFPDQELAQSVERIWQKRYRQPLPYVRGDDWLTSNVSIFGESRAEVYSPLWSTEEDFRQKGGILLWLDKSCSCRPLFCNLYKNDDFCYSPQTKRPDKWLQKFPDAEIFPVMEFPQKTYFPAPPIKIRVALIPPADEARKF